MNSTITNSFTGVSINYRPDIPQTAWFFFYKNRVENCEVAINLGTRWAQNFHKGFALISENIFRNCGPSSLSYPILSVTGSGAGIFLFNNQIIGNAGIGVGNRYNNGMLMFLEHNSITHNYQGVAAYGWVAMLHNYIVSNEPGASWWPMDSVYGGGIYLDGPAGVILNNSIQLNGVTDSSSSDNHGDGIALNSYSADYENTFVINRNNLGNSVWDMQDIYIVTEPDHCESSSRMTVDATWNSWMTDDPSKHIWDSNDDMCAGAVDYSNSSQTAMVPAPLQAHPVLNAPQDNSYMPGTNSITFSWEPVNNASKYLIGILGPEMGYSWEGMNRLEIVDTTSFDINFPSAWNYGMYEIHWFVVAGNDDGWSLPSELRKITFSNDWFLVSGRVLDENDLPVASAFIDYYQTFSDKDGRFMLIPEDSHHRYFSPRTYNISKRGYVTTYTFPRGNEEFNMFSDLVIFSEEKRDLIYQASGEIYESTKGYIASIVVNENDQAIAGAIINLSPASGKLIYLDSNGDPDLTLNGTGASGEFIILNVIPGDYEISANVSGHNGAYSISIYPDAVTADALLVRMSGNNPPSKPDVLSPESGKKIEGSSVEIKWNGSTDPDGDSLNYYIYVNEDPYKISETPIKVVSASGISGIYYAGLGSSGLGLFMFGTAFFEAISKRKWKCLLVSGIIILMIMLVSCGSGGGGSDSGNNNNPQPGTQSYTLTGLQSGTYYWKVVADDGRGGKGESEIRSFYVK